MFTETGISLSATGTLNKLVSAYLDRKDELRSFYGQFPDHAGFEKVLQASPYSRLDRLLLSELLLNQSKRVTNSSEQSLANIQKLKLSNTFTITTGHQLCLFTGPLYFVYKLLSTIQLAGILKEKHADYEFVPVYWMASEDHDFAEVNHFHVNTKTITWNSDQTGAVGEFKTEGLKDLLPLLRDALGISASSAELLSLFERAYTKHQTLAQATHFLVNELFGKYGLVTIDGNQREFKAQFTKELSADIFENSNFNTVSRSIEELETLRFKTQVNPRNINCFYMEPGLRGRIEPDGKGFKVAGTEKRFSREEVHEILDKTPEKISPNVVLRPLYQQKVLPNLAYVGGPGELAYWLEFKSMFDAAGVFFPVLVPRKFVSVVDNFTKQKIKQLGLGAADLFKPESDLIKELQQRSHKVLELEQEEMQIQELFTQILKKTQAVDPTLDKKVKADLQKTLNALNSISQKANRAQRRKMEIEVQQIRIIKEKLFPHSIPQERYENFSTFYLRYGGQFLEEIRSLADPLKLQQSVVTEK